MPSIKKGKEKADREKKMRDGGLSKKLLAGGGEKWAEDHPKPAPVPVDKNSYSHVDFIAVIGDKNAQAMFESKDKNVQWFLELVRITGMVDFNDSAQFDRFASMAGKVGTLTTGLVANVVGG